MSNLLYYPYINLPKTDWTLRTLIYYDNIGSIVPEEYFYEPEKSYEKFMLELVRECLVTPINPIQVLESPWNTTKPFIDLLQKNEKELDRARFRFQKGNHQRIHSSKFSIARIHSDKFDKEVLYQLKQLGLAENSEGRWYSVEGLTAKSLMSFLATIISSKTERLPITDSIQPHYYKKSFLEEQKKVETVLASLIPFPNEINLNRLLKFKEKHADLLRAFRTKIESIALDPNILEGTPLFYQRLAELAQRKEELTARMNESQFNNILFGTVCGLIGAYQGLAASPYIGSVIGGLPGFASAVHSAMKIERAENIFDQSGLKYLALAYKRIGN